MQELRGHVRPAVGFLLPCLNLVIKLCGAADFGIGEVDGWRALFCLEQFVNRLEVTFQRLSAHNDARQVVSRNQGLGVHGGDGRKVVSYVHRELGGQVIARTKL